MINLGPSEVLGKASDKLTWTAHEQFGRYELQFHYDWRLSAELERYLGGVQGTKQLRHAAKDIALLAEMDNGLVWRRVRLSPMVGHDKRTLQLREMGCSRN